MAPITVKSETNHLKLRWLAAKIAVYLDSEGLGPQLVTWLILYHFQFPQANSELRATSLLAAEIWLDDSSISFIFSSSGLQLSPSSQTRFTRDWFYEICLHPSSHQSASPLPVSSSQVKWMMASDISRTLSESKQLNRAPSSVEAQSRPKWLSLLSYLYASDAVYSSIGRKTQLTGQNAFIRLQPLASSF